MIGLTIDAWWNLTPREAQVYFRAYEKKQERQLQMADTANYILGKYVMMAVNKPGSYPDEPLSLKRAKESANGDDQMTDEDEAKINAIMGAFAAKAKRLPAIEAEAETTKEKEPENVGNK